MKKIEQKDLDWLKAMLKNNGYEANPKLWLSGYFLMWLDGPKKEVALLYIPPIHFGDRLNDSMYTLELFKALGWSVKEADSISANYVKGAPGFGETAFLYNDLPFTWAQLQELYKMAVAKLGTEPCKYSDTGKGGFTRDEVIKAMCAGA